MMFWVINSITVMTQPSHCWKTGRLFIPFNPCDRFILIEHFQSWHCKGGRGGRLKISVPNQVIGFAKGQPSIRVHIFKTYIIFSLYNMQDTIHDLLCQYFS